MKQLGYKESEIKKILNRYPINRLKEETLLCNINRNFNYFIRFGYQPNEIIQMSKKFPAIYCYSIEKIDSKIETLALIGYTKKEMIQITRTLPTIYGLKPESIIQKINDFISLGYTKEEVIKMTKKLPALYSYSKENIEQKMMDLMSLGYTKQEVIEMTVKYSGLYSLSMENIKQKVEYFKEIGLEKMIIIDPEKLMQSLDLTYARYELIKEKNIKINEKNYGKLFINGKAFTKQYEITKQELLEKYNYQTYINQTQTIMII